MKYFKYLFFVFIGHLINKILSIKFLEKYSKVSTYDGYVVFNSSSFSLGENMYFSLSTDSPFSSSRLNSLNYKYYSNKNKIDIDITPSKFVNQDSDSSTTVMGKTTYSIYFTINKKEEEFEVSNGNYLYLHFDCTSTVEVENTKKNGGTMNLALTIVLVVFIFVVWIFVIYLSCCRYCRERKIREAMIISNTNMIGSYGVSPYNNTPYYPQQPVIQQNSNINVPYAHQNEKLNFEAAPQSIQICQNANKTPSNTNRPIKKKKVEKPNIQKNN